MKRLLPCYCFTCKISKPHSKPIVSQTELQQISRENMENSSKSDGLLSESTKEKANNTGVDAANNIIINHDFSGGLHSWHANCCKAIVVSSELYVAVTDRRECWQGLEQDITSRVSVGSTYSVTAYVGVSGAIQHAADVQGTVKLEYTNSDTQYVFIGRRSVANNNWEKLEGTFSLSTLPDRAVFYLEGPPPGVDLLVKSVVVSSSSLKECYDQSRGSVLSDDDSITLNPNFDDGLNNWSGRGCKAVLHDSMADGKILPFSGKYFASATERTQGWNGIQQDITGRVKRKLAYEVTAVVRIFGNGVTNADVRATLYVQGADNREQYIGISSSSKGEKWVLQVLEGYTKWRDVTPNSPLHTPTV